MNRFTVGGLVAVAAMVWSAPQVAAQETQATADTAYNNAYFASIFTSNSGSIATVGEITTAGAKAAAYKAYNDNAAKLSPADAAAIKAALDNGDNFYKAGDTKRLLGDDYVTGNTGAEKDMAKAKSVYDVTDWTTAVAFYIAAKNDYNSGTTAYDDAIFNYAGAQECYSGAIEMVNMALMGGGGGPGGGGDEGGPCMPIDPPLVEPSVIRPAELP